MGTSALFSTTAIEGLNTQAAPHLLPDGGLKKADNVDFSEHGAVSSASPDTAVLTAGGGLSGAGWAELGGVSYYIYKEFDSAYAVKAYNVSTGATSTVASSVTWGSGDLQVIQGDDVIILTDGTVNRIWDGTNSYAFGAPSATNGSAGDYLSIQGAVETAITGISVSGGTVTVSTGGITISDGDKVWISGVVGMTEINDALYEVTDEDGSDFTLVGVDGTDWAAYSSGGTVYRHACGLSGDYVYRTSEQITLPSGESIEGSLSEVTHAINGGAATETTVTLSETDVVTVYVSGFKTADVTDWLDGSFTAGTDLTVSRKVYRSKLGDTAQAYLLETEAHADVYDENYSSVIDQTHDSELGAQWTADHFTEHDAPPTFSCAATHSQRLYMAVGNKLYYSSLDGFNYCYPLDYERFDEDITAIVSAGPFVAVFGATGAWIYDPFSVKVENLKLRYGVSWFGAVETFDGRVWFANDLGLFTLDALQFGGLTVDAVQSKPVSWPVDSDWRACSGTWSLGSTHDTLYISCYETTSSSQWALHVGDGMKWSTWSPGVTVFTGLVSDKANNRVLYRSSDSALKSIGTASGDLTATVRSKRYITPTSKGSRLKVLIGPNSSWAAAIYTNKGESYVKNFTAGTEPTIGYAEVSDIVGETWEIEFIGTGTLYGWSFAPVVMDSRWGF